jgi:hypothetical protein
MQYLTCCVNSTYEKITAMTERARQVTYRTARRAIGSEAFDELCKAMGYVTGIERGGLRIKNDYAVSFHKSVYDGQPCYYICQSAIEYIFV